MNRARRNFNNLHFSMNVRLIFRSKQYPGLSAEVLPERSEPVAQNVTLGRVELSVTALGEE